MDIDKFIVQLEAKKDPVTEMWGTPVSYNLREKLRAIPREKRYMIHESTRRFLNHLIEVYSSETEQAS